MSVASVVLSVKKPSTKQFCITLLHPVIEEEGMVVNQGSGGANGEC